MRSIRKKLNIFLVGDSVYLKEDKNKELYTIVSFEGISRGPIRQYPPSRQVKVVNSRGGIWYFRKDALCLKD